MTAAETARLKLAYVAVGKLYGKAYDDDVLRLIASTLEDLPYLLVVQALSQWSKNPRNKFAPLPAEIREMVAPETTVVGQSEDDFANQVAHEIWGAIGKFGQYQASAAQQALRPEAWRCVEATGGWVGVCEVELEAKGVFIAQMRDLARAIRYKPATPPMIEDARGKFQALLKSMPEETEKTEN